jgi:undecaprenyl-diphosphatase
MDILQIISLALIQGLTEFLPISSSAHLILAPRLLGFADQGLAFDVAIHFGSLGAVMLYFRNDIHAIVLDWFKSLPANGPKTANSWMGWSIIIGTLPVVLAGLLMKSLVENDLRAPLVIAYATLAFGGLLWWADHSARRARDTADITLKDALIVGLMQCLALIPGTSRSGITMTAGLLLGLTRQAASRFSFLLAIPTVLMSSALVTFDLLRQPGYVDWQAMLWGILLSFLAAYACIHYFLRFIERIGMLPFVIYRLLLGALILTLAL